MSGDDKRSAQAGATVEFGGGPALHYEEFVALRALAYRVFGISLPDAKQVLVASRLRSRLRENGLENYGAYHRLLEKQPTDSPEMREFINALTTNKTGFFREPHHFKFVADTVIPAIAERARHGGPKRLQIWSAACSTGQEPYTLAMTLLEQANATRGWDVNIVATDIDTEVLAKAEAGVYAAETIAEIPQALQAKYLLRGTGQSDGLFKIRPEVKRLITFRQANLVAPTWPVRGPFDLILCRNVVIYFDRPTQETLFKRFSSLLDPTGFLIIGHSETLHWMPELYQPAGPTIYSRTTADGTAPEVTTKAPAAPKRPPGLERRADKPASRPAATVPATPRSGSALPTLASLANRPLAAPSEPKIIEKRIEIGGVFASQEPSVVKTLLGSCIAACLFDPEKKIGGMNHFLLPDGGDDYGMPTRFGINAMEVLINEIMKLGGDRRRFVAKVFGGAHVIDAKVMSSKVGEKNAEFIKQFLATEKIPIHSEKLGGTLPLEVRFYTHTGRAQVAARGAVNLNAVLAQETEYCHVAAKPAEAAPADNITLF